MDKYSLPTAQTKPGPVDIPMFYKRDPDSVYHPPDNIRVHSDNSLIMRSSGSLLNHSASLPSTSLVSSAQPTYGPFEESMSCDEDTVASQYTEWPLWDDMDCRLAAPISSARSSIECTPPRPNDPELSWPDTRAQQYDFYGGQEFPQSPSNSYNEHVPLSSFQPHMPNRIRPTPTPPFSSPAFTFPSSATTSSTLYQKSLPHISTVSPYASSDSSSSSSSPLSTPEITIRTPITVHQPRPSRRIPIVSLSELASACDDFSMSPTSKNAFYQKPFRELLSPLTTNISTNYTSPYSPMHSSFLDEMGIEGAPFPVPFVFEEKNAYTAPTHLFNGSEEVVICSCGCMGSYTIPQNS